VRHKQHKKAFSEDEALHADKLLGLVHVDVWGLAKTPSFGGERYFVSFINDFFWQIIHLHFEKQWRMLFKIQRFSSLYRKPDWRKN
jgi:hypothetical protein